MFYGPARIAKTYQCPSSDGLGLSCGSGLVELEVPELEVALCMAVGPACSIWGPVNVDRCCYLYKASAALIKSPFRSLSQFKLYHLVMLPSNCWNPLATFHQCRSFIVLEYKNNLNEHNRHYRQNLKYLKENVSIF